MQLRILFITLNLYVTVILPSAGPKPLDTQMYKLHFLTNMACKITVLCRMKTPLAKKEDEELITITSEPGRNTFLTFEEKESFYLRGIGVQSDRNLHC